MVKAINRELIEQRRSVDRVIESSECTNWDQEMGGARWESGEEAGLEVLKLSGQHGMADQYCSRRHVLNRVKSRSRSRLATPAPARGVFPIAKGVPVSDFCFSGPDEKKFLKSRDMEPVNCRKNIRSHCEL
jgi:hypothetical protein